MHIPLVLTAPREALAAAVFAVVVVCCIDVVRPPCHVAPSETWVTLPGSLLLQAWPLCWRFTAPSPHVAAARVATAALFWVIGRLLVWHLQRLRPRYFLCPTRPRRVPRPPVCMLANAKVVPAGAPPLLIIHESSRTSASQVAQAFPPGKLVVRDFRDASTQSEARQPWAKGRPLRVVTWNIERGIEMKDLLRELKTLAADVLLLQEVDVGCARSGNVDTGAIIAKALGMQLLYATEFVEHHSPLREPKAAGGGVHGNAIATWLDVKDAWCFHHEWQPYDWSARAELLREPRDGARIVVGAELAVPSGALRSERSGAGGSDALRCYSLHLENFCGIVGRWDRAAARGLVVAWRLTCAATRSCDL